jgi:hypothetical protein
MKRLIIAVTFALSACGVGTEDSIVTETHGERRDAVDGDLPFGLCKEKCGATPTFPPAGQTCTLVSDTCEDGLRTCVYDCKPTPPPKPRVIPRPTPSPYPPPLER